MSLSLSVRQLRQKLGRQKGQCTWCGGPLPKRRRSWCSEECIEAWRLEHDWYYIRLQVLERDKGVCALCGVDCSKLYRIWLASCCELGDGRVAVAEWLASEGFGKRLARDLWEADHIVPRSEGGTNALDNLRTLCLPCHHKVTREWRQKKAEARRLKRKYPLLRLGRKTKHDDPT